LIQAVGTSAKRVGRVEETMIAILGLAMMVFLGQEGEGLASDICASAALRQFRTIAPYLCMDARMLARATDG
jgi:hypothetical protein